MTVAITDSGCFNLEEISAAQVKPQVAKALLVVDPTVPEYEQLLQGVWPGVQALVLHPVEDAIAQITSVLDDQPTIESLHLVVHGSPGCLHFSSGPLNLTTLEQRRPDFQAWATHLAGRTLAIYACDVATGEQGRRFLQSLQQLTGTRISAADHPIGQGYSWQLTVQTTPHLYPSVFQPEVMVSYAGLLTDETEKQLLVGAVDQINFTLEQASKSITEVTAKVTDIPFLGDKIAKTDAFNFVGKIFPTIQQKLNDQKQKFNASQQDALQVLKTTIEDAFNGLAPSGVTVSKLEVKPQVTGTSPSNIDYDAALITLDINVEYSYKIPDLNLSTDLGTKLLTLDQGKISPEVKVGLNLATGFSKALGFYLDTDKTKVTSSITARMPEDFTARGTLSFLQVDVSGLSGQGLTAEYFNDRFLSRSQLVRTVVEPKVNKDWGTASPAPKLMNADNFSVRWSGQITPTTAGNYTFYVKSDDGARLWINHELVIDAWKDQSAENQSKAITLAANQKYDIQLEYYEREGNAGVDLSWQGPGITKQIISSQYLTPIVDQLMSLGTDGLYAQYFNDKELRGLPILERFEAGGLEKKWGDNAPPNTNGQIKADDFGVRWFGNLSVLESGQYTFRLTADDGARLFLKVDGKVIKVIDLWDGSKVDQAIASVPLTLEKGKKYAIELDYYERGGGASTKLEWKKPGTSSFEVIPASAFSYENTSTPISQSTPDLRGLTVQYFNNEHFQGVPSLTRLETQIKVRDSSDSFPSNLLSKDNFSVRWTGQISVPQTTTYQFMATFDDVVKIWVNDQLLLDKSSPGENVASKAFTFEAGKKYDIRVEMVEYSGGGFLDLQWRSVNGSSTGSVVPIPLEYLTPVLPGLTGEYFNNTSDYFNQANLSQQPIQTATSQLTRIDSQVDFDYGYNSPSQGVNADYFSIRWTGQIEPRYSEEYTFFVKSGDGARLWVNDQLIIDQWNTKAATEVSGKITLQAGQKYDIQLEYFENSGTASVNLAWASATQVKETIPSSQLSPIINQQQGKGFLTQYSLYTDEVNSFPVLTRIESQIQQQGAPDSKLGNRFKVSWRGTIEVADAGKYTFTKPSENQLVELIIDGNKLSWQGTKAEVFLTGGSHSLQTNLTNATTSEKFNLTWQRTKSSIPVTFDPTINLGSLVTTPPSTGLLTEYFRNVSSDTNLNKITELPGVITYNFDGANRSNLNVDWGSGGPKDAQGKSLAGSDNFIARLTGRFQAPRSGDYQFNLKAADDWVQVLIDGKSVAFKNYDTNSVNRSISLEQGQNYDIEIRYHEKSGGAELNIEWILPGDQNSSAIPLSQFTPKLTPKFVAQYFNNPLLTGSPVLTRGEKLINHDWGTNAPAKEVPADGFSVRWQGTIQPKYSETYTFTAETDDGVRLWINGDLVIDQWPDPATTNNQGTISSTGQYTFTTGQQYSLRMEYYDRTGSATAKLFWQSASQSKALVQAVDPASPLIAGAGFQANYYNNADRLGVPAMTQLEPEIRNNWGDNSPNANVVDANYFGVKWYGFVKPAVSGSYTFYLDNVDDYAQLQVFSVTNKQVNAQPLATITHASAGGNTQGSVTLTADQTYLLFVDYQEKSGGAKVELWWQPPNTPAPQIVTGSAISLSAGANDAYFQGYQPLTSGFLSEYFNGKNLDGPVLFRQYDSSINYDWGNGSPLAGNVPTNDFSVRWQGEIQPLYSENYTFLAQSDDGVRVKLNIDGDERTIIDQWQGSAGTVDYTSSPIKLEKGKSYPITVEYYENTGNAKMSLSWSSPSQARQIVPALIQTSGSQTTALSTTGTAQAEDIRQTQANLDFTLNLIDPGTVPGTDKRLTLQEIQKGTGLGVTASLSGKADLALSAKTSFNGAKVLPSLGFDINASAEFSYDYKPTSIEQRISENLTTDTSFEFDNVKLYLGSFLTDYAVPIVQAVNKYTKPFRPVIDFLKKDTKLYPILGQDYDLNEDKQINVLELLIKQGQRATNTRGAAASKSSTRIIQAFNTIDKLINTANRLNQALTQETDQIALDIGSFNLSEEKKKDSTLTNADDILKRYNASIGGNKAITKPSAKLKGPSKEFMSLLEDPGSGFQFPILQSSAVLGLLLGTKDVTLMRYQMPELSLGVNFELPFPIVLPIGLQVGAAFLKGGLSASTNLAFGYDALGLYNWKNSQYPTDSNSLAKIFSDGFFIDDFHLVNPDDSGSAKDKKAKLEFKDLPELTLKANVGIGAYVGTSFLNAGIAAGIEGKVEIDLKSDPNNGKVRLQDLEKGFTDFPKNLSKVFDASGKVSGYADFFWRAFFQSGTERLGSYDLFTFGGESQASAKSFSLAAADAVALQSFVMATWVEPDAGDIIPQALEINLGADQVPFVYTGAIGDNPNLAEPGKDVDLFRIYLRKGEQIKVSLNAIDSTSELALRLFQQPDLMSQSSQVDIRFVKEVGFDQNATANGTATDLTFTAPEDAEYILGVSGSAADRYLPYQEGSGQAAGSTGNYTLQVELVPTAAQESAANSTLNDTLNQATTIALTPGTPVMVSAQIGDNPQVAAGLDVDLYAVSLQAGDKLALTTQTATASELDTYLRVFDGTGQELFSGDDLAAEPTSGQITDAALEFVAPRDGIYYVGVSDFNASDYDPTSAGSGSVAGLSDNYQLSLTLTPRPLETNNTLPTAIATNFDSTDPTAPYVFTGIVGDGQGLAPEKDVDYFKVDLIAGKKIQIKLNSQNLGANLDSFIRLYDATGNLMAEEIYPLNRSHFSSDLDFEAASSLDSYLTYTPDQSGAYYVAISNYANRFGRPDGTVHNPDAQYVAYVDLAGDTLANARPVTFTLITDPANPSAPNGYFNATGAIGDNPDLRPGQDVDFYAIELKANQAIAINLDSDPTSQLDLFFKLWDATGKPLAFSDDRLAPQEVNEAESKNASDPYLTFTATADGTYYLGVSTYEASTYHPSQAASGLEGGFTGTYSVNIDQFANGLPADYQATDEQEPKGFTGTYQLSIGLDPLANATYIETGTVANQKIGTVFETYLAAGDRITLDLDSDPATPDQDLTLSVLDQVGHLIAFNDDGPVPGEAANSLESSVSFTAALAGVYYFQVNSYEGTPSTGTFTLNSTLDRADLLVPELLVNNQSNDQLTGAIATGITPGSTTFFTRQGVIGDNGDRVEAGSDVDLYRVELQANQVLNLEVQVDPQDNFQFLPRLRILDAQGKEQTTAAANLTQTVSPGVFRYRSPLEPVPSESDPDTDLADVLDAYYQGRVQLSFIAPQAGTYYIGVSNTENTGYNPVTPNLVDDGAAATPIGAYRLAVNSIGSTIVEQSNDTLATATPIALSPAQTQLAYQGILGNNPDLPDSGRDVDFLKVDLRVGDQLKVALPAEQANAVNLALFDPDGNLLPGNVKDPLQYTATRSGAYYIGISTQKNQPQALTPIDGYTGRSTYQYNPLQAASGNTAVGLTAYTVNLDLTPRDTSFYEPASNDAISEAIETGLNPLNPGKFRYSGYIGNHPSLAAGLDVDFFKIELAADQILLLDVDPGNQDSSQLDTIIRLFNQNGEIVASNEDGFANDDYPSAEVLPTLNSNVNSFLRFKADASTAGVYYIAISDRQNVSYDPIVAGSGLPGEQGAYQLDVTLTDLLPGRPKINVKRQLPSQVTSGQTLVVPITATVKKPDDLGVSNLEGLSIVFDYDQTALTLDQITLPAELAQDWEIKSNDIRGRVELILQRKDGTVLEDDTASANQTAAIATAPAITPTTPRFLSSTNPLADFNLLNLNFTAKQSVSDPQSLVTVRNGLSSARVNSQLINLTNPPILTQLAATNPGILRLDEEDSNVLFRLLSDNRNNRNVNEVGLFVVDDEQGRINGIAPNAPGYLNAALQRARVILSAIFDSPQGFNPNLSNMLDIFQGQKLGFYVVAGSTTDTAKTEIAKTGQTQQQVFLSTTGDLQIAAVTNGGFDLNWKSQDSLRLGVSTTDDYLAQGSRLQRDSLKELLDLRSIAGSVNLSATINRKADFNNLIGFYKVADANGTVVDPLTGQRIQATQENRVRYAEVALKNRVEGLDLTTPDNSTSVFSKDLTAGSIYAPFLITNGNFTNLSQTFENVYFPYLGVNSDQTDHIRLLGTNVFGFEDLAGGGDKDFNDLIVKLDIKTPA